METENEKNQDNLDESQQNPEEKVAPVKSAWQVAKELKQQDIEAAERREQERIEAQRVEREKYEKNLHREKVELLKKKQGVDEKDEDEIKPEKKEYTLKEKISTFFYHNKWWLGFGLFAAALVGYIIYDTVTQVKYDMYIMLLSPENDMYYYQSKLLSLFEANCEDVNGDGEVNVALLYYSPSDDAVTNDIYHSNNSSMAAQFQMGDTVLIIADPSLDDVIYPSDTLADLELYIDDENIDNYGYYIDDTAFKDMCGVEEPTVDGMYIGLRAVVEDKKYTEEMQRNFDIALNALKGVIEDVNEETASQDITPAE